LSYPLTHHHLVQHPAAVTWITPAQIT
jgi:hypothetical protein